MSPVNSPASAASKIASSKARFSAGVGRLRSSNFMRFTRLTILWLARKLEIDRNHSAQVPSGRRDRLELFMSVPDAPPNQPQQRAEYLPPVTPPTATFLIQLFLIPLLIVSIIVVLWLLFSWVAHMGRDNAAELAKAAYHLGNRHVPVQVGEGFLRLAADHVLEEMLKKLSAKVSEIEAPFEPEAGAYAGGHHQHDEMGHGGKIHEHDHEHCDHDHDHHRHK